MDRHRWTQRLRTLAGLGRAERVALVEAAATLAVARATLRMRPFNALAASLTRPLPPDAARRDNPEAAGRIGWAIRAVHATLPFRAQCLEQAIAATMMLRRRGHAGTLLLGAARDRNGPFEAHAWVTCGTIVVVGGPVDRYVVTARYGSH